MTEHDFELLREWVRARYRESGRSADVVDILIRHNDTVLGFTERIAAGEDVTAEELETLRTIAILHDVAKAETPLLLHAQVGGELAGRKLRELGKDEGFVCTVCDAIVCHMGPFPFIEEEVRKHAERTGEQLDIPRPETRLEKLFYDADMLTLMDTEGIEKVVLLRSTTPEFVTEDRRVAAEEGTSQRAAAYASALQSVRRAAATMFTETGRRIAEELLEAAERYVAERVGPKPSVPNSAAG